ncbi:MAG: Bcr/CflA family multidrug efflux MFS transporter [Gammaproteobacteria bacterium]
MSSARIILILATLSAFGPFSIDMYLPSLPALARSFATDASHVQYTLSAFLVGFALGQLIYGPLSDRTGRRRPLLFGVALYVLTSVSCALASSVTAMIVLRFAQGLGACAGIVVGRAIVRDRYESDAVARTMSLIFMVMTVAPMIAPLLGGWLMVWLGWRAIFWFLAGFGALCWLAGAFGLDESLPAEKRLHGGAARILRDYAQLLRARRFLGYALSGGLVSAGMFAYIAGSPFVFIELHHLPPQHYGWLFGINVLGVTSASFINSRLVMRFGADRMLSVAVMVAALAGAALLLVATLGAGGLPPLLPPLFLFISCVGFSGANATAGALALYPQMAGTASALLGLAAFGLGALCGALVGLLHDGSALPMALVMAGAGLGAWVANRWLVRFG